jgi:VWFA-related protein
MTRCAVACVVALAADVTATAQRATFSSRLEAVRVDVLVTEAGRPILGLQAGDFAVLDNGVTQTVDLVSFETLPLNMVLVFDHSNSVTGERRQRLQEAAAAALGELAPRDQAALLTFSHKVTLQQALTHDRREVIGALDSAMPGGDTSLFDGAYAGLMLGVHDPARNLVLIFSDGVDTASFLSPAHILDTAKRSDAVVYTLSPKGAGSAVFLRELTEQTGGSAIEVESLRDLSNRFLTILEEFRHRYLVSYSPRGVPGPGWHRLEVKLKGRRGTVRARPGYRGR